jgi:glycosyltransferase involved in cell wall biosynthesis
MNKLIFVNRYFYPDHSATSQMLSDLAFGIVDKIADREIHIVTSRQRYDDASANLSVDEIINNVHIHRVWTSNFGRQNLTGRTIDYISFYVSSAFKLMLLTQKGDLLVAKTDPPLISVITAIVAKLKRAELINWLQDLFPEVAAELGVKLAKGLPFKILKAIRNKALKGAKMNIVIGDLMAARLFKEGVEKDKIKVIHNWADGEQIKPVYHEQNPLRQQWGLEGKFVVGYSGNLGRSHDFSTILEAAEKLKNNPEIIFLFIGAGAQLPKIKETCQIKGLENVLFKPYQLRENLGNSLSVSDVHLISLKPELEGLIVPSKFYGILAAGRSVIFIGGDNGELSRIIIEYKVGQVVEQGDVCHLVASIRKQYKQANSALGENIRQLFDSKFSKGRAFREFKEVLVNVGA